MELRVDVAVVGGGIAGMSVAGELARAGSVSVAVLEQENQLAYHSSGRSAAAFMESYGSADVRALTRASRPLFDAADTDPQAPPLLRPRPVLWLAHADQVELLDQLVANEAVLEPIDEAQARAMCPPIRPGWTAAAAVEPGAQDIDVAALFDRYRRLALHSGATLLTGAGVHHGDATSSGWQLHTTAGEISCTTVVDAAGAWADTLAQRCGVAPLGLAPLRRTVAIVSCDVDRAWPMVADVAETFYFRPESNGILLSPADESPSPPCDARPATEDIALAIERANEATTLGLRHVSASWAGLRTFARDRNLVAGFDPDHDGFFWLAGQGGYGMQTAPAMAVLAASLVRGEAVPQALADEGVEETRLSPARLRA